MNNQCLKMIGVGVMASAFCTASLADGQITVENVGLATPESVEYYAAKDVYLVTNINGSPFAISYSRLTSASGAPLFGVALEALVMFLHLKE